MMISLFEYLKSPELVVRIQNYFGIKYEIHKHPKSMGNFSDYRTEKKKESFDICLHDTQVDKQFTKIEIQNKFWYYLFVLGTELGDEIFYATFIPFWFWNIDGFVGRRFVLIWSITFYIGQCLKDIIRWPRPGPPVIRLQKKWEDEYGMPSTHAISSISIPFTVLIFTQKRYIYSTFIGILISIFWSSTVCLSRIYLGMHSVLDVIAGFLLTIVLMIFLVPIVDFMDSLILSNIYSPILILSISILLIAWFPRSDKWTLTRGDTTMAISVCAGIELGAWMNYQLGDMIPNSSLPPYEIIWPTYRMFGLLVLRTVLGMCCIIATRTISKSISYAFVCAILRQDKNELKTLENSLDNKIKTVVELSYKFFTCAMIGFNTHYLLPKVFKLLNIGRPDFYTEL